MKKVLILAHHDVERSELEALAKKLDKDVKIDYSAPSDIHTLGRRCNILSQQYDLIMAPQGIIKDFYLSLQQLAR